MQWCTCKSADDDRSRFQFSTLLVSKSSLADVSCDWVMRWKFSYMNVNLCPDTALLSQSVRVFSLLGFMCCALLLSAFFNLGNTRSPQRPTNGSPAELPFAFWLEQRVSPSALPEQFFTQVSVLLLKYRYLYITTSDDDPNNRTKDEEKRETHQSKTLPVWGSSRCGSFSAPAVNLINTINLADQINVPG